MYLAQLELISILPDLTPDSSADQTVAQLLELKEQDSSLLLPILDAVSSLRLSPETLLHVTSDTLSAMEAAEPTALPAIIRFLVHHTTPESAEEIIKVRRAQRTQIEQRRRSEPHTHVRTLFAAPTRATSGSKALVNSPP